MSQQRDPARFDPGTTHADAVLVSPASGLSSQDTDMAYHVRRLVDQAPSMMAYWDRDLLCRFANRAYELWFGVDPDRLIGRSIAELLGPKLFALNEPYMRAAPRCVA
jgi:PAS domain-containing protein